MNNGNKKVCKTLNYIEYFFTVAFAVIPCISIYALASLVYISKEITSSSVGLNICAKIATIKKYKWIIKKKEKNHDEIVLLAKTNLDCVIGVISMFLINSYIGRGYFLLKDAIKEHDGV